MTRPPEPAAAHIPAPRAAAIPHGTGRQFVVCGDSSLAYRLVEELTTRYRADVTVILADPDAGHGPEIAAMGRVRVVRAARLDAEAFRAAALTTADAVALLSRDDIGNVYAALRAQEICPGVRAVLRVHNPTLRRRIGELFEDAQVLSDIEIATPAFVAASLGVVDPTIVPIGSLRARVIRRRNLGDRRVICGLARTDDVDTPALLPDDEDSADLVLAIDDAAGIGPAGQLFSRRDLHRLYHNVRRALASDAAGPLVSRALLVTLAVLGTIVVGGAIAFWLLARDYSLWQAVYLMLFTAVGAGNADPDLSGAAQIAQAMVTLAGVAMLPVVSAAIVQATVRARLALPPGALDAPEHDHVVVVGVGNLGTHVIRALTERGIEVVAIDHVPDPAGMQYLRDHRIYFIVGDARRESTLRRANVADAAALVVLTTDDVANLEYALQGRALRDSLRVVLRLFDGDFADRVKRAFDITTSRSVSYLAAPAFAAAMVGREVIGTIPVRRRVLLVAEAEVCDGGWLVGKSVADVYRTGTIRVLAVIDRRSGATVLAAGWGRPLEIGDRLIVAGSRAGVSWILGTSEATAAA